MDIQFIDQTIQLTVGRNEGIPLNCQNFFDQLPDDCGDTVSFINGATPRESGGRLTLKAGSHIKIFEDKERGRIYIGLDFDPGDVCVPVTIPPR